MTRWLWPTLLVACGGDHASTPPTTLLDTRDSASIDASDDTTTMDSAVVDSAVEETVDTASDVPEASTAAIPEDTVPCEAPEYWPFALASERRPVTAHYRAPEEAAIAREIIGYLEHSWDVEVDQIGFRAPLSDEGLCGADGDLDVFLWKGVLYPYTDTIATFDDTPWDDESAYLVLDTTGFSAGSWLDSTVAHELNHACQAAYDWTDTTAVYEMTSLFIEDQVYDDDDNYQLLLFDFQGNPDWSIDHDDSYASWYMYGPAIYLGYLRDHFFAGDPRFITDVWEGLKSPEWAGEPDYQDSIDDVLAPFGRSFLDSVVEFQKWRWYVADDDDGRHLEEAGQFPENAKVKVHATVDGSALTTTTLRPMMLGAMFVEVEADAAVDVALDRTGGASAGKVQWVVQVVPGLDGTDGSIIDADAGTKVDMVAGRRVIIVTALPGPDTDADPDTRTDDRFKVTLRVAPHD